MKTVIMAGGRGTRISSVASDIPKPMIKIGGKPVLEREIECLQRQGFTDIIITVSHLAEHIIRYFGDGSAFGVNISYFIEETPLGNAGSLFRLRDQLTEDFLLLNADAVFDVDFHRFVAYHKAKGGLATLFVHANSHPYDSGVLIADESGAVQRWLTKEDVRPQWYQNRVNAGIEIISPELLKETMQLSFSIHPDFVTAEEISRVLQFPAAIRVESFPECEMEIVTFRIEENSRLTEVPLRKLGAMFGQKVLVCCVERDGTVQIPGGDYTLRKGDRISVTGLPGALRRFFISVGSYKKPVKNVILLGGSRSAVHLTRLLESTGVDVTIIENDPERCQTLAEMLQNTAIHCADGTNTAVLQENGIAHADGFVSLTGFDEDNMILGLYASKVGVGKVISKVNNTKFVELLRDIFPDTTLSPQELVAERISGYVRGLEHASEKSTIEALYYLGDPRVTATEFVVGSKAACTGKALKDLPLISGVLLAAVIRAGKSYLPDGQTVLLPEDRVIVVSAGRTIVELDDILSESGRRL